MESYITLNPTNLAESHICCAISDKKCSDSYQAKKDWLRKELANGYVFRRLDARAKVFIEYGPAEQAWLPIDAPGYLNINCFWVSGKYKKNGHGKALLQSAWDDAIDQKKKGLVTVVGLKKFHFMSDTKWLLRQGFEVVDETAAGFGLLVKKIDSSASNPAFKDCAKSNELGSSKGITVYYSNRCPYAEYHVNETLPITAQNRGLTLKTIKLDTLNKAQSSPTPATIFSLFLDGKFVTTDLSACMDSRFDKVVKS